MKSYKIRHFESHSHRNEVFSFEFTVVNRLHPLSTVAYRNSVHIIRSRKITKNFLVEIIFRFTPTTPSRVDLMKPFFNNRCMPHLPQETEVLNLLYQEIKNTQNVFPSEKLKVLVERWEKKIDRTIENSESYRDLFQLLEGCKTRPDEEGARRRLSAVLCRQVGQLRSCWIFRWALHGSPLSWGW